MNLTKMKVFLIPLMAFAAVSAFGSDWYFSPDGNDDNYGNVMSQYWKEAEDVDRKKLYDPSDPKESVMMKSASRKPRSQSSIGYWALSASARPLVSMSRLLTACTSLPLWTIVTAPRADTNARLSAASPYVSSIVSVQGFWDVM